MRVYRTLLFLFLIPAAGPVVAQSTPIAAPGLAVPNGSLPWVLDQYDGKPELVPFHRSAIELNNHKGSNVVRSFDNPFYKQKATTELSGPHGRNALHTTTPVFYLHIQQDPDSSLADAPAWSIVRATIDKDRRVFAKIEFTQLTGNAKRIDGLVPAQVDTLPGGWLRITPKDPLPPGEYALTPVMKIANTYSVYVYDFSLDPALPNPSEAVVPQ